ncbi:MAG: aspartate--tRNA ligase [Bacteroidetes bacterium]|nr:aspartate--tRNA ligase [Bacteroidota bacterium]
MYRTHTCGELSPDQIKQEIKLSGWVQKSRDLGGMTFIDLRDRFGITQLVFNMEVNAVLCEDARKLNREDVISIEGEVAERSNKNPRIPTGEIEIIVKSIQLLSKSKLPPFTIEDQTDGGDDLRMKYRYLDIRRNPVKNNLLLRHKMSAASREYLNSQGFVEIETPCLIKSTPEGARDFVVPSRMHPGEFYALPQSPQTFKQLLMIAGMDKYYQLVRCFRDEDLRADRQPEFTQIDCEMSFVTMEDILRTFEGLTSHLFSQVLGKTDISFERISYADAMKYYGTDKPDTRFDMRFVDLNQIVKDKGFKVFDQAELVVGINAKGCGAYSRKELDQLTDFVRRPQVGASGLVHVKCNEDGSYKSSVDKFYDQKELKLWAETLDADAGDLLLILAGETGKIRFALSELRLELADRLGLKDKSVYKPLWVTQFPLLEWDENSMRFHAKHHPFTSPMEEDIPLLKSDPSKVRANAYDLVINGVEIGGGSIRIHNKELQKQLFKVLGFTDDEAQKQFGFLMNAFEYGAPPHGGIAFGFDRWCALFGGSDSIRDFIAFPKNNAGKDVMIESPSVIAKEQLDELGLVLK